jgi:hypothetical protein
VRAAPAPLGPHNGRLTVLVGAVRLALEQLEC